MSIRAYHRQWVKERVSVGGRVKGYYCINDRLSGWEVSLSMSWRCYCQSVSEWELSMSEWVGGVIVSEWVGGVIVNEWVSGRCHCQWVSGRCHCQWVSGWEVSLLVNEWVGGVVISKWVGGVFVSECVGGVIVSEWVGGVIISKWVGGVFVSEWMSKWVGGVIVSESMSNDWMISEWEVSPWRNEYTDIYWMLRSSHELIRTSVVVVCPCIRNSNTNGFSVLSIRDCVNVAGGSFRNDTGHKGKWSASGTVLALFFVCVWGGGGGAGGEGWYLFG